MAAFRGYSRGCQNQGKIRPFYPNIPEFQINFGMNVLETGSYFTLLASSHRKSRLSPKCSSSLKNIQHVLHNTLSCPLHQYNDAMRTSTQIHPLLTNSSSLVAI